ncbi:hypothetical protein [Parapedobacter sp.]
MMPSLDFVHFVNTGAGLRTHAYNGYLSFLTTPAHHAPDPSIAHRYVAHDRLYVLELKDEIQREIFHIQLKPQSPCLWVVIALIGDCTVHAEGTPVLASGNSAYIASTDQQLTLSLHRGKNWLFVVGFP